MSKNKFPLSVLLVDHESILGGAEIGMVQIVNHMPKKIVQYDCAITGPGELAESLKKAEASNIHFMRMDGWRWWETGIINRIKLIVSLPLQILNLFQWINFYRNISPEIIHFNLTRLVEPVVAAKLMGIPTIMHFREPKALNSSFFGGNSMHFKLMQLTDYWLANSCTTFDYIKPFSKGMGLRTIYNGIDIENITKGVNSKSETTSIENRNNKVALIGTITPSKNIELFIKIAEKILQFRPDIKFYIAGKGDLEYKLKLKNVIKDLKLADKVCFVGYKNDIGKFLRDINFVIHTSNNESFGRVYLESMAAGRIVFAIKSGAAEEFIEHGINGFIYDQSAIKDLVTDFIELIPDFKRQNSIIYQAQKFADNFGIQKHCSALLDVYFETLLLSKNTTQN